jgi:hypothetical protein
MRSEQTHDGIGCDSAVEEQLASDRLRDISKVLPIRLAAPPRAPAWAEVDVGLLTQLNLRHVKSTSGSSSATFQQARYASTLLSLQYWLR